MINPNVERPRAAEIKRAAKAAAWRELRVALVGCAILALWGAAMFLGVV